MPQIKSWAVSDAFWAKVEPLIPGRQRAKGRKYRRRPGGGRKPIPARRVFSALVYVAAHRLSVEGLAQGIWQRERDSQAFSTMASGRVLSATVAFGVGGV